MATLTSTGAAVNLTSSTNWSPAQVPATGDDLIISTGATLTLDTDMTLGSITLNTTTSRLAVSGSPRTITITGLFVVNAVLTATAITLTSQLTLIIAGGYRCTVASTQYTFTVGANGHLTLDQGTANADLIDQTTSGTAFRFVSLTAASATLITRGRIGLPATATGTNILIIMTGGVWDHTDAGDTTFNGGAATKILTNSGANPTTVTWNVGRWISNIPASTTGVINLAATVCTATFTGTAYQAVANNGGAIVSVTGGQFILNGKMTHLSGTNTLTVIMGLAAIFRWKNQSVTIAETESFTLIANGTGLIDFGNLLVTNNNKFVGVVYGAVTYATSGCVVTTSNSADTCAGINFLDITYVTTDVTVTLPPVAKVETGQVYGYNSGPLTGTGLIFSPAAVASTVRDELATELAEIVKASESAQIAANSLQS